MFYVFSMTFKVMHIYGIMAYHFGNIFAFKFLKYYIYINFPPSICVILSSALFDAFTIYTGFFFLFLIAASFTSSFNQNISSEH